MVQKICMILSAPNQLANIALPVLSYLQEHRERIHRIAIYNPQGLLRTSSIAFVGFISGIRKPTSLTVVDEIQMVDKTLIAELVNIPAILSYSSLELREGIWCNLVLLSDINAKNQLKNTETHAYAAYQLAPRYYAWIRLHNGVMPGGLLYNNMNLQKTRYYTFQEVQQRPSIQELSYEGGGYA